MFSARDTDTAVVIFILVVSADVPWVPVVEAESNFIDSVRMRHHHVETVLMKMRTQMKVNNVSGSKI